VGGEKEVGFQQGLNRGISRGEAERQRNFITEYRNGIPEDSIRQLSVIFG